MAIGDRILAETMGGCTKCYDSGQRIPVPEEHTETETAWRCFSCGETYLERAMFECAPKDAEITW